MVSEEIEHHIEDQKEAYIADGDEESTAMIKALEQMGNPVEVGKQLDKLHKPLLEWKLLLIVLALCSFGLLIQLSINGTLKATDIQNGLDIRRQIMFLFAGFILMGIAYLVDYSILGKYAKIIWAILLFGCILYAQFGRVVNGIVIYLPSIALLFIPLYGGIVYAYRKRGYLGLIKCLFLSLITMLLEMRIVVQSNVYIGFILSCLLILTIAVCKNWFGTSIRNALLLIWGWPLPLLIIIIVTGNRFFTEYQWERLNNWISIILNPQYSNRGYLMNIARETVKQATMFGESRYVKSDYIPGLNPDYILTYVIGRYGIAAGVLLIALFIVLFERMIHISLKQKNSLGVFVGIGCSMVFITLGTNYILANLGFQFLSQVNLPFVSYGGASLIINFIVMGFMLSIFRNANIIKEIPYKKRYKIRIEKLR